MLIRDIMDVKAARIRETSTFATAAELLVLTQASDLIVIDHNGRLVGVVSEGDLIRAVMPNLEAVLAAGGSLEEGFRSFLKSGKNLASQTIKRLIITAPITVAPTDELLQTATIMIDRMIRRLPVVENGRFVGTVSRADICWALLCSKPGNQSD